MEFKDKLKTEVSNVETILNSYLPKKEGFQQIIMEAMEYSVMAGGKRIRPILVQEAFRMFGGMGKIVEPFMAAMEMLHTYSLVHDDLPAMDNDDYRRGRKTTHVVYGEAVGILAGDALLNYAYETAANAFDMAEDLEKCKRVSAALRVFMEKAGIYGMIGGQTVDVINEGKSVDAKMLDFIFRLKTGALLEASLMIGAILAGAKEEDVAVMEQIGSRVGLAFQIQDDILDVTGDAEVLGKPVLSDEKNNKTTYVTLFGINKAQEDVKEHTKEAEKLILGLKEKGVIRNTEFFEDLMIMLIHREK